jgi:hypothetical protein
MPLALPVLILDTLAPTPITLELTLLSLTPGLSASTSAVLLPLLAVRGTPQD